MGNHFSGHVSLEVAVKFQEPSQDKISLAPLMVELIPHLEIPSKIVGLLIPCGTTA